MLEKTETKRTTEINKTPRQGKWLEMLKSFWQANKEPISMWVGWRLALFIIPIFAGTFFPPSNGQWTLNPAHPPSDNIWMERLVRSWTHWDAGFYTTIASDGYVSDAHYAFFPLYPHLIRLFSFIFTLGNATFDALNITGIVISSLAALATCVLLYQLARQDYDDETSRLSVLYLLSFPMAFYLFAVYTEALFMALAIGSFYAARQQRWLWAMILAALCILTKNQGLFVPVALALEYGQQIGWNPRKLDRRILAFAVPILTLGGWLVWNELTTARALKFLGAQNNFDRYFAPPWRTIEMASEYFFQNKDSGTWIPRADVQDSFLYDYPITIGFIILALIGIWAVWKGKLRPSYLVFFAFCLLQPLFSPNRVIVLLGLPRYMLIIFPAFFLLALMGRRWKIFHYAYLGLSLPMMALILARFALNYWV